VVAPNTPVSFVQCDLANLASVKAAAEKLLAKHSKLDVLLANAGIMAKPPGLTSDGFELQFGTNHLGHALLIKKLLPLMQKTAQQSGDVRIILVSSTAWGGTPSGGIVFKKLKTPQEMFLGHWLRYGQSKLANVLYAKEIARRYPELLAFSLTPGVVATDLVGSLGLADRALVYVTNINSVQKPEDGVLNHLWGVSAGHGSIKRGAFYEPVGKLSTMTTRSSESAELAKKLWEWTDAELEKWM
jgi:NAD(P)-dependent dehydrogenase (short-subunit alcohol dehydrogenase family)